MNLEKIAEDIFRDAINYISKNKCTISDLRRYVGDKIRSRGLRLSFPVCISIGNCIGFNCEDLERIIEEDDLCKIEFGLTNVQTSENFYFGKTRGSGSSSVVDALEDIYKCILKESKNGAFECTDDLRLFIEGKCAEADLVPIKNCISFQQDNESGCGYFYLNYLPEYDNDDYLLNLENLNFDINGGDRFDINITVLEDNEDSTIKYNHKIVTNNGHTGSIFKILPDINNSHRNLKLKSSKMLYNLVKKQYLYDAFHFNSLDLNGSNLSILGAKMGLRECIEKDLFEEFPVSWVKDTPVYFRKFTITF